jgi:hypothetical protein
LPTALASVAEVAKDSLSSFGSSKTEGHSGEVSLFAELGWTKLIDVSSTFTFAGGKVGVSAVHSLSFGSEPKKGETGATEATAF